LGHQVPLSGLSHIKHLPLRELDISGCEFNDSHLAVVGHMLDLRKLSMCDDNVKDASFSHLDKLVKLERLYTGGCTSITSTGLSHIKHLPLQALTIIRCNFRDSDMALIGQLSHLTTLVLSENYITSAGLSHITHLPLHTLFIATCSIKDSDLATVAQLSHLRDLSLVKNEDITDVGLSHLTSLKNLQFLYIGGCDNISAAGRAIFGDKVKIINALYGNDDVVDVVENIGWLDTSRQFLCNDLPNEILFGVAQWCRHRRLSIVQRWRNRRVFSLYTYAVIVLICAILWYQFQMVA